VDPMPVSASIGENEAGALWAELSRSALLDGAIMSRDLSGDACLGFRLKQTSEFLFSQSSGVAIWEEIGCWSGVKGGVERRADRRRKASEILAGVAL
jgi:hypothetical protein